MQAKIEYGLYHRLVTHVKILNLSLLRRATEQKMPVRYREPQKKTSYLPKT